MEDMRIIGVGNRCPDCGGRQFAISCPEPKGIRPDWPLGVLGIKDCRGCGDQEMDLIRISSQLRLSVETLLVSSRIKNPQEVIEVLFPH